MTTLKYSIRNSAGSCTTIGVWVGLGVNVAVCVGSIVVVGMGEDVGRIGTSEETTAVVGLMIV